MGEILDGVWRFEGRHPDWSEDEGGGDGWEPDVAWWAIRTAAELALVDPLVEDWAALDRLINEHGGATAIVRTCHWHQRTIAQAAERYRAPVWAKPAPPGVPQHPYDRALSEADEVLDVLRVAEMERDDEIALWLPAQRALVFGDAMIRSAGGELRVCPDSWTQPDGGPVRLRAILGRLTELPVEHVLVSHGPLVTGDGLRSLNSALA